MKEINAIYQRLKESKKYQYLCDDTLYRISEWSAKRFKLKKAVKAAKDKLHQVYGAYIENMNIRKLQKLLEKIERMNYELDLIEIKEIAIEIMRFHKSTLERRGFMAQFYSELFNKIGKPQKIIDLACGLNPFAVPCMELEPGTSYMAFDIDSRLIALLNRFFSCLSASYTAQCADILVSIPEIEADTVFLFKTLPCLEQQEKGISEKLIASLKAKSIVISFPLQTLTGKAKGMANHYHKFASELIDRLGLSSFKLEYHNEVFYVLIN